MNLKHTAPRGLLGLSAIDPHLLGAGQDMSDEVALREVALAALNGTELSEDLREFLANLRSPATAAEAVHRHTDTGA